MSTSTIGNVQPRLETVDRASELLAALQPEATSHLNITKAVSIATRVAQERVASTGAAGGALGGTPTTDPEIVLQKREALVQRVINDPSSTFFKDQLKILLKREPTSEELKAARQAFIAKHGSTTRKIEKKFRDKDVTTKALQKLHKRTHDKVVSKLSKEEEQKCGGCEKTSKSFLKCSNCKEVVYCSKECQRAQWPTHKLVCVVPTSNAGAGAGAGSAASKS